MLPLSVEHIIFFVPNFFHIGRLILTAHPSAETTRESSWRIERNTVTHQR